MPHVGWNALDVRKPARLLDGLAVGLAGLLHALASRRRSRSACAAASTTHANTFAVGGRARQRLRRAVPPGEVERRGAADSAKNFLRIVSDRPMLTKRIIACLDVRDGQVVKGVQFQELRHAGDPGELARRYNVEGIDEVVILDITATLEKRQAMARTIGGRGEGDLPAAHRGRRHPLRRRRRRGRRGRRRQGQPEHGGAEAAGAHHARWRSATAARR